MDESCKFGRKRSSFTTTSEEKEERGTNPKNSTSTSRREGKDVLEFVEDTCFDWSDECLPSSAAANNEESDVSNKGLISSSDSEPDDSDDEDFDIEKEHPPDSSLREDSSFISSSSEDAAASEKENTVDAPPTLQENLCCNGVAEAVCSRNSATGECSCIKHGKHEGCEDEVDSRNCTKSKTVQIQEEEECAREPLFRKQTSSGMENQKRKIGDEISNSKRNQGPEYESCSNKNTNADKESKMSMVEDPRKDNYDFHSIPEKILETNPCLADTTRKNKIWFSTKTHQNQRKNELSKVLIDSMLRRFEAPSEKSCEPEQKEEACAPEEAKKPSLAAERSLPLKFRFEDDEEESKPAEKSEYDNMVEGLFSEMHQWMYSDSISDVSNDSSKVC